MFYAVVVQPDGVEQPRWRLDRAGGGCRLAVAALDRFGNDAPELGEINHPGHFAVHIRTCRTPPERGSAATGDSR